MNPWIARGARGAEPGVGNGGRAYMAVEFQRVSVNTNGSFELAFSDTIKSFAIGVEDFDFKFTGNDHHLHKLSLEISPQLNNNKIAGTVTATLNDVNSGHIDNENSSVRIVAIAIVTTDENITFTPGIAVPGGGQIGGLALASSECDIIASGMNGFSMGYGSGEDHHIYKMTMGLGTSQSGSTGALTAQASMVDDEGHSQEYGDISGTLISQEAGAGLLTCETTGQLQNLYAITDNSFPVADPIYDAIGMLTAVQVQFQGKHDHHVSRIRAGCRSLYADSEGNFGNLYYFIANPGAEIRDKTNHNVQDDDQSWVQFNVFLLPKTD